MGKEYIMDTVSLEGVETFNEETAIHSRITQINYQGLEGGRQDLGTKQAFSCQTTVEKASIDPSPITTISIGGFEDSVSGIIPQEIPTANKIKLYTGEQWTESAVLFYEGKERFTIDRRGYVGINNPDIDRERFVALDVRSTTPIILSPKISPQAEPPIIAITHPYFNIEGAKPPTPAYIGGINFRSIQSPGAVLNPPRPTDMAGISVETNGEADVYEDARVNLSLSTTTGEKGSVARPMVTKHLEINGYENKTKIFTQLNLGKVPAFRDLKAAISGGLVSGDVWQDTDGNLKIIFGEQDEEQRARIE
jgi:hypothetical protein